jgi:hypothetical protein
LELLSFEWRGDKDRAVKAHATRRTARQTLRHARKRFTQGGRKNRTLQLGIRCARLHAKRRGYDNPYGVPGNGASLTAFFSQTLGILKKWLHRHSPRRSDNWAGYTERLGHFPIDRPRLVGRPKTRMATAQV